MSTENNDDKDKEQLSSIWENNNQNPTSDSDIINSNFSTLSMSIDTSHKSNNIDISSDHTNYQTNNVEDATTYSTTQHPIRTCTFNTQQHPLVIPTFHICLSIAILTFHTL